MGASPWQGQRLHLGYAFNVEGLRLSGPGGPAAGTEEGRREARGRGGTAREEDGIWGGHIPPVDKIFLKAGPLKEAQRKVEPRLQKEAPPSEAISWHRAPCVEIHTLDAAPQGTTISVESPFVLHRNHC